MTKSISPTEVKEIARKMERREALSEREHNFVTDLLCGRVQQHRCENNDDFGDVRTVVKAFDNEEENFLI